ncbi:MAG: MMPL family transporter [Clostridia bacterium]|nr:MMPL family transporter [Clostridia bacterium]
MINSLATKITKNPKKVVIIALLLLIPSLIGMIFTPINYDILSYLPEELDSVEGLNILDEDFNEATMAIIVVQGMSPNDIYEAEDSIAEIENVNKVLWMGSLSDSPIPLSMLPEAVSSMLYNEDKDSTLMMVQFKQTDSSNDTLEAISQIKKILNKQCLVSGTAAMSEDMKEMLFSEMPLYIVVAVGLATVILMFTMNSFALNVIILVSLGMAVLYNMGTNFIFGEISFITQSIAAILQLAVTIDYSVFLIDRYTEEKPRYKKREDAMKKAITSTFSSLSGSSLTTIFGFLALCFMRLTLGFDIGIVMAKGVIFGVVTVVVVLPAIMLLCEKAIDKTKHKSLVPSFNRLNKFTIKFRPVLAIICILIIIPSWYGQNKVEKYYNLLESMPDSMGSVAAMDVLKEDFNMASSHFVITKDSMDDNDNLEMIEKIQNVDGVSGALSLKSILGTSISADILPESLISMLQTNGHQLVMITSVYAASTDECNAQIDEINAIIKSYDNDAMLTGEAAMYKDLIAVTDEDFITTSILSMAAIFIIIAILFKSISIPFILVLSIELAIWINIAISFFSGEVICFITPTIISCVQLGATVDYAILLTTRYREEIRKGINKKDAMLTAANESQKSIFQSAMVFFAATFGVYLACDIDLIKSMCIMLARGSIISALVIILFLTPILVICEGFINKTTIGWRKEKPRVQKVYIEVEEEDDSSEAQVEHEERRESSRKAKQRAKFNKKIKDQLNGVTLVPADEVVKDINALYRTEEEEEIIEHPVQITILNDNPANTTDNAFTAVNKQSGPKITPRTRIASTASTKRKDSDNGDDTQV